jgi:hypothetical protein
MSKKVKLEKGKEYYIEPIEGENYDDCQFYFGFSLTGYEILEVDGQYFRADFIGRNDEEYPDPDFKLEDVWWDSEGFKITKKG